MVNGCKLLGVLSFYWCLCVTSSWAQIEPLEEGQTNLKLLTWNVQLLPRGMRAFSSSLRKQQKERLPHIIEHCQQADYDVIVFQEVFDAPLSKKLQKALKKKYPYQCKPLKQFGRMTSSGVLIVSRYSLTAVDGKVYKGGVKADAWAAKGCTLVRLDKEGKSIYIAGTHLQSGGSSKAQKQRSKQYKAIAALLKKNTEKDAFPVVITGDLNTQPNSKGYKEFLKVWNVVDAPIHDSRPYTIDERNTWVHHSNNQQLDYILLQQGRAEATILRQNILREQKTIGGEITDLSDHYGVIAQICW